MQCGEFWLMHFPFTHGSGGKRRPVLIVSGDDFNRGDDVVVVPVSASADPASPYVTQIDPGKPQFGSTNLARPSSVKWTKPFTISKSRLLRRIGDLDGDALSTIQDSIASVFS